MSGSEMTVVLVAAVAANGVIGVGGGMPWHLPADLRRFKSLTLGHTIIMGRRTFESIGSPLPGRTTVVITRDPEWSHPGVRVVGSLDRALQTATDAGETEPMVVGGGQIYAEAIGLAHRLEITHVEESVTGDVVFPVISDRDWQVTAQEEHDGYRFVSYVRRPGAPRAPAGP